MLSTHPKRVNHVSVLLDSGCFFSGGSCGNSGFRFIGVCVLNQYDGSSSANFISILISVPTRECIIDEKLALLQSYFSSIWVCVHIHRVFD